MKTLMKLFTLLSLLTWISIVNQAQAFSLFSCPGGINPKWDTLSPTWRINSAQFGSAQRTEMNKAASRIRSIRGSNIRPLTTSVNLGNPEPAYGNGANDVVLDTAGTYLTPGPGGNARAIMSVNGDCSNLTSNGRFIEVDIVYRSGANWTATPNQGPYVGALFSHELGHGLGVGHEDTGVLAQMNASVGGVLGGPSNNEQGTPSFHGQDASAIRLIYPDSTTGVNAYVSKFRRGNGPFGTANNTTPRLPNRLINSNGNVIGNNGAVVSNQVHILQYTAGNTGTSARNITVNMRISSPNNQNIHLGNQIIATRTHFLQAGQNVESQINFLMPPLIAGASYYFGYTVNPSGDIDAADDRTIINGRYIGF